MLYHASILPKRSECYSLSPQHIKPLVRMFVKFPLTASQSSPEVIYQRTLVSYALLKKRVGLTYISIEHGDVVAAIGVDT